jgi:hypothetical protein
MILATYGWPQALTAVVALICATIVIIVFIKADASVEETFWSRSEPEPKDDWDVETTTEIVDHLGPKEEGK